MRQATQEMPTEFSPLPPYESLTPNLFSTSNSCCLLDNSRFSLSNCSKSVINFQYCLSNSRYSLINFCERNSNLQHREANSHYSLSIGSESITNLYYSDANSPLSAPNNKYLTGTLFKAKKLLLLIVQLSNLLNLPYNLLPT